MIITSTLKRLLNTLTAALLLSVVLCTSVSAQEMNSSLNIPEDLDKAISFAKEIEDPATRYSVFETIAKSHGDYQSAYRFHLLGEELVANGAALDEDQIISSMKDATSSDTAAPRNNRKAYYLMFGCIFLVLFVFVDFFIFYAREKEKSIKSQKMLSDSLMESMDEAGKAKDEAIKMKEAAIHAKEQAILSREQAIKAKEEAEKANNMKTTFVQNMSHEIRTPLNAIVGFSQLMSLPEGFLSKEEKDQYASYILNNSNLLTMLIDDILNINDVETGNYKVNLDKALCNDMCRQAMNSVEYRVPAGVDYKFTTDIDDSYLVTTDERRVRQVLINFLTNACKHTIEGAISVNCTLVEDGHLVEFSVSDTGPGVPVEMKEKIFERFTKLDSFKQGAGLGLHICRIIAENLEDQSHLIQIIRTVQDSSSGFRQERRRLAPWYVKSLIN